MAWKGMPLHASVLLLPVVVAVHLLLLVGVGFLLSAANVFFRDVQYVFDVLVLVWMFASPVLVDTAGRVVAGGVDLLVVLNPLHPVIEGYRDVLLRGGFRDPAHFALGAAISGLWCVLGFLVFARTEPRFAERA
jgi:ABC-type polysaccharide/polyol phosphate export permease